MFILGFITLPKSLINLTCVSCAWKLELYNADIYLMDNGERGGDNDFVPFLISESVHTRTCDRSRNES